MRGTIHIAGAARSRNYAVLVEEHYQRLVGYVVADVNHKGLTSRDPQGTVFFVAFPIEDPDDIFARVVYAVTCRHVIEWIHEKHFKKPAIQLNRTDQTGIYEHGFQYGDWTVSEDSDVAIWRVDLPEQADY
jgi:hypothetical protein